MSVTRSFSEDEFISESYTDIFKQAMELKRTRRELEDQTKLNEKLRKGLTAKERVAEEISTRHAVEMARVERQRDELRELLLQKTDQLAATSDRLQSVERELSLANDTIERLREDGIQRTENPFHVQERPGNAYDELLAHVVKNSGEDRQRLLDRYRDIATKSSNMIWQTLVDDTMLTIGGVLSELSDFKIPQRPTSEMVRTMVDDTTLQPSFVLYVVRKTDYQDMKSKRLTKKQMEEFKNELFQVMNSMVYAWANRK